MPHLHREGIALAYERSGGDGAPVVLIHGWCCDRSFLAPQAEHFAARGFDVVALDLRGHGASDKPVQPYPIAGFADDVAFVIESLGLARPILIGHSMGGIIAYEVARRHPGLAGAIAMLDCSITPSDPVRAKQRQTAELLKAPDYAEVLRDLVGSVLFLASDDAARRARILDRMAAAPQHVMATAYAGLAEHDPGEPGTVTLPSLYIAADEPAARADPAGIQRLLPQVHYGKTIGSGHFCQLEVPEQVNAMIDRFLKVALASGRTG